MLTCISIRLYTHIRICMYTCISTAYEFIRTQVCECVRAPRDCRNLLVYLPRGRIAERGVGYKLLMWRILGNRDRVKFIKKLVNWNCASVYLRVLACLVRWSIQSKVKTFLDEIPTYYLTYCRVWFYKLTGVSSESRKMCLQSVSTRLSLAVA